MHFASLFVYNSVYTNL